MSFMPRIRRHACANNILRAIAFIESEPVCSPASMKHISPFVLAAAPRAPTQSAAMAPSFGKDLVTSLQAPEAVALSASPNIGPTPREPSLVPRTSPSDSAFTQRAVYSHGSSSKSFPHPVEHNLPSPSHSSVDGGTLPPYTE